MNSEAFPNDLKGHIRVLYQVYQINSVQGFGLCKSPGETTQQPALLGVVSQLMQGQPSHDVAGMGFPCR